MRVDIHWIGLFWWWYEGWRWYKSKKNLNLDCSKFVNPLLALKVWRNSRMTPNDLVPSLKIHFCTLQILTTSQAGSLKLMISKIINFITTYRICCLLNILIIKTIKLEDFPAPTSKTIHSSGTNSQRKKRLQINWTFYLH
jgi:hypothetical protein